MTPAEEWVRCWPWIKEAVESNGLYDKASIEAAIAEGRIQFWPGRACVALTEILTFPLAKVLNVFAVGGPKGRALQELTGEMEPHLVTYGQAKGCTKIMGYGIKPNWRPICEGMGYAHLWTVMAKDIQA